MPSFLALGYITTGAMFTSKTPLLDWLVLAPMAIPLFAGAIIIMMRRSVALHPFITIVALLATLASCLMLLMRVKTLGPLAMTMGNWYPPFGITFVADLLGVILVLSSSIVVLCAALYAMGDISARERRFGFYPLLLMLLVGVNGSFLTGDVFNLYVWFEVFLISSFGLIILGGEAKQLDGAIKYCFLNLVATTLFLIATGYLYGLYGTLNMADLSRVVSKVAFEGPLVIISILFLVAFSMKAAAFPLYFWLPASYHTPKIVVSALFAGLLTKVGVYALLRTFTIILPPAGEGWIMQIMLYTGIATMVCGALGAVVQTDLRRMFSYLLIAGIGFMMLGIGIGTKDALTATIFYMVHSILYMTALYLIAGVINHYRGSLDLRYLSGTYSDLPLLSMMFLVLVFIGSGFPPFSGFWPKLMLISESMDAKLYTGTVAIIFSSFLAIVALGRAFAFGFWRPLQSEAEQALADATANVGKYRSLQYVPVLMLIGLAVFVGIMPAILFELAGEGARGLLNNAAYIEAVLGGVR